ncbi:MAG: hypothetical protein KAS66_08195 [Candidatus Omnitrophica bacterium]|nr:hypothetical protein [Candidatus Omnitrophota bacterium]
MATLNDVEFKITKAEWSTYQNNVVQKVLGSGNIVVHDLGYGVDPLPVSAWVHNEKELDDFKEAFHSGGLLTYVKDPHSGKQYKGYALGSVQEETPINNSITEGIAFQFNIQLATPYAESSVLSCRAKEITSNNQEWSAEDAACNNLLDNWSFEDWSDGASSAPDSWLFWSNGAGTISRESTIIKHGTYSANIDGVNGSTTNLRYELRDWEDYVGKDMNIGVWIYTDNPSNTTITLSDGVGSTTETATLTDTWEFITCTHTVDSSATKLFVYIQANPNGNTAIFADTAVLIEGSSTPDSTFIRDIDTDGNVDALPDIKIKAGAIGTSCYRDSVDTDTQLDTTMYNTSSSTYILATTQTFSAIDGRGWAMKNVSFDLKDVYTDVAWCKVTLQAASYDSGTETTIFEASETSDSFVTHTETFDDETTEYRGGNNEDVVIRYYIKNVGTPSQDTQIDNCETIMYTKRPNSATDVDVYNTADTSVKCAICNDIDADAEVQINTDGTGTYMYSDYFVTDKYLDAYYERLSVTHDTGNDELDIADDGYLIYKIDTKYPITGIPTLTSQINITSGTPTIQIAKDDGAGAPDTWYDIDTAIVDDVDTEYELDNATSLSLKGETILYFRFDCVKTTPATLSIKSFKLNVDINTTYAKNPIVSHSSGSNTFRCDQNSDSGLNCEISLMYRDRWWV